MDTPSSAGRSRVVLLVAGLAAVADGLTQTFDVAAVPKTYGAMRVVYTTEARAMEDWIATHCGGAACVGFDTESLAVVPGRSAKKKKGTCVLQLAVKDEVLVAQGSLAKAPRAVADLLGDADVFKAGVSIDDDAIELYRDTGLAVRGRFDLGGVGAATPGRRVGLATLARTVLDLPDFWKSKKTAMSDWTRRPLSEKQVLYAARDAWVGAAVFEALALAPDLADELDLPELEDRAARRRTAKRALKALLDDDDGDNEPDAARVRELRATISATKPRSPTVIALPS